MKQCLLIIIFLNCTTLLGMDKEEEVEQKKKKVELLKNAAHEAKLNILVPLALKLADPLTYRFPKDICITLKSFSIIQDDETINDQNIIRTIVANEEYAHHILKDLSKDS